MAKHKKRAAKRSGKCGKPVKARVGGALKSKGRLKKGYKWVKNRKGYARKCK